MRTESASGECKHPGVAHGTSGACGFATSAARNQASGRRRRVSLTAASASLLALALAACAGGSLGDFMPGMFGQDGKQGPLVTRAAATDFSRGVAEGSEPRLLQAQNRGELSLLVLDMPNTEARLNKLLERATVHWPHPLPKPARVKVSMKSEYSGATFADGTITLGLGTFANVIPGSIVPEGSVEPGVVASDEELLYLLAHEFAHYALGHHLKSDSLATYRDLAKNLMGTYNQVQTLQRLRYRRVGDEGKVEVSDQRGLADDIGKAIGAFDMVNALAARGFAPAWNRGQEDEADVLALDLMIKAGISEPYYEAMFSKLTAHESLSKKATKVLEGTASTITGQLLDADNIAQAVSGNAGDVGDTIKDIALDQFWKAARTGLTDYFGQTHRDPQVRFKGVQNYQINAYPGTTLESLANAAFDMNPSTTVISAIKADAEFLDARKATVAYYDSIARRSKGDFAGAETSIKAAMATRFGREAAILFEAARVAESSGRPQEAITRYRDTLKDAPMPEAYRALARLLSMRGMYADAEKVIADGEQTLTDVGSFLPSRIFLEVMRKDNDKAIEIVKTCRREEKRQEILTACEASLSGLDPSTLTFEQQVALQQRSDVSGGMGIFDLLGGGKK